MKHIAIVTIVFLVGSLTVRAEELKPDYERIRSALQRDTPGLVLPAIALEATAKARQGQQVSQGRSDVVWEGLLIGAAIGGVGGYFWARNICGGTDDTECFLITAPVGLLGGAGIGALIGAVADKLHK